MVLCRATIPISDPSQIGDARRQAIRVATESSFGEADCGRVAIVASELATNLARYAVAGEILLQAITVAGRRWIEVLAIDRGPGIPDIGRCLEDGFSTGGTSGTGLGAARRMSTEFDVYSTLPGPATPGGTVVFCRLAETAAISENHKRFSWAVVSRPALHETECGDAWCISERQDGLAVMVVDGLGHGPEAAKAAHEATALFDRDPFAPLPMFFDAAHVRMHGTRGGAVAAAQIDAGSRQLKYVGVGNIAGHLRGAGGEGRRGLFSHNGTVGVQIRKIQQFDYEWPASGLLVMHSDGLQGRWLLEKYPGLAQRHPAVIAGVLYRDFTRGHDDVTVAVVRLSANGAGLSGI